MSELACRYADVLLVAAGVLTGLLVLALAQRARSLAAETARISAQQALATRQQQQLAELQGRLNQTQSHLWQEQQESEKLREQATELVGSRRAIEVELKTLEAQLASAWYPSEELSTVNYRVALIGRTGSGKTVLVNRLTDPVYDADSNPPHQTTGIVRRAQPLTEIPQSGQQLIMQHALEFYEWGGEDTEQVAADMVGIAADDRPLTNVQPANQHFQERTINQEGFKAIVFCVDLGARIKDASGTTMEEQFSLEHIQETIQDNLNRRLLTSILNRRVVAHFDTIVVFINKLDLIDFDEERAIALYKPFIDAIDRIWGQRPFVVAGSAMLDLGTRVLNAHLVRKVIPEKVWGPISGQTSGQSAGGQHARRGTRLRPPRQSPRETTAEESLDEGHSHTSVDAERPKKRRE